MTFMGSYMQDMEKFYNNPEYIIINVPPPFMFKAKIFSPSRLCAVFHVGDHTPE